MEKLSKPKLTAVFTKLRTYVALSDLFKAMREDDIFDYNTTFILKEPKRVFSSEMKSIYIESFAILQNTCTIVIYIEDGTEYESDLLIEGIVESIFY